MVIDQCLDLSCALGQLRNCNCATDLLWAVGAMRSLQDAIQATTVAAELSALGGDASAASADPDAPKKGYRISTRNSKDAPAILDKYVNRYFLRFHIRAS